MKKALFFLLLLFFAAAAVPAATPVKKLAKTFSVEGLRELEVDLPVGELRVMTKEGSTVDAAMTVTCRRCGSSDKERAREITLVSKRSRARLSLEVKGYPKHSKRGVTVKLTLSVPKDLAVVGRMGVGEATLEGRAASVRLDVGVGEVDMRGDLSAYRSADLKAGIGDVSLRLPKNSPRAKGFLGGALAWDGGPGKASLVVKVGVGDVEIRLK